MPDPRFMPIYRRRGLGALVLLTVDQLAELATQAGFTGSDVGTAAAIAMAESSGNPNPPPNAERSYGLWQINLPLHPEFNGWNLLDPQTNANAAFSVFNGPRGFSAWTTYRNGRYQSFLQTAPPAPPLTIDARTGLPIEDSTPTPPPAAADGGKLALTLTAFGALLLYDLLTE